MYFNLTFYKDSVCLTFWQKPFFLLLVFISFGDDSSKPITSLIIMFIVYKMFIM